MFATTHLKASAASMLMAVNALQTEIDEMKRGKLSDALRGWYLTRNEYEALDGLRKRLNELLESMSRITLPEIMEEEKTKTVSLDDLGYRFTVAQRVSCSMLDQPKGFEWLRSTGNGALIKETVNAQTLSSFAKQEAEAGRDLPPDLFKISLMKYTSATKM